MQQAFLGIYHIYQCNGCRVFYLNIFSGNGECGYHPEKNRCLYSSKLAFMSMFQRKRHLWPLHLFLLLTQACSRAPISSYMPSEGCHWCTLGLTWCFFFATLHLFLLLPFTQCRCSHRDQPFKQSRCKPVIMKLQMIGSTHQKLQRHSRMQIIPQTKKNKNKAIYILFTVLPTLVDNQTYFLFLHPGLWLEIDWDGDVHTNIFNQLIID